MTWLITPRRHSFSQKKLTKFIEKQFTQIIWEHITVIKKLNKMLYIKANYHILF